MKRDVYNWYKDLERGAKSTADLYLKRLTKFCKEVGFTPNELLSLDDEVLRNIVLDFISGIEGKSGSYINSFLKALKSWFRFNNRSFNIHVRVREYRKILEDEEVPTKSELRKLLRIADLRARVAIALMAFSGLRLGVLGNYTGFDGLRVGDILEIRRLGKVEDLDVNSIEIESPITIVVRQQLSKTGHQYLTFLCEEGCEYLMDYLDFRLRNGEMITLSSPVISKRNGIGFLKTKNIYRIIKDAIIDAGFSWRPYVLRHYFDTYLLMAEAARIIPEDYRVFWMGHKGDIEHQYTTNKWNLPHSLVNDMKLKYQQAAEMFLETKSEEKKTKVKQKVIKLEELDFYLESGWEYVTTLPDGRVIVGR